MATYKWAAACRIAEKTTPAQIAGEALDELQHDEGGTLTPPVVVNAARPIAAPLHPLFEWDDVQAAERHREDQARHIISSIRIIQPRRDPRDEPQMIRAFVNLTEGTARGYVPLARVLESEDLLQQAISQAAAELRAFEKRYAEFTTIALAARKAREEIEAAA